VRGLHFIEVKEQYDYPLPVPRPSSHGDKCVYIDFINDEPFYVGMGNWDRVRNPDRNDYHLSMLYNRDSKDRWIRRTIARNLSTNDALSLEHTLILCYGRKDIGTGILLNKNKRTGIDLRSVPFPALQATTAPSATTSFFSVLLFVSLIIGALLIRTQPLVFIVAVISTLPFFILTSKKWLGDTDDKMRE